MTGRWPHGIFEVFGIEIEHMIVDRDTLDVKPCADELIRMEHGAIASEIERGEIAWSNELALHVIETKTNGPAPSLDPLRALFQAEVGRCNELLDRCGAMLMPGGMHPWMDPDREFRIWPHEYSAVYEAFNRIFDCRGHGWSNLQSCHLNLPFGDAAEFGRLHAAIRLILPILPALAASSPIVDGRPTGFHDTRVEVYRTNARRIPSVTGHVIPEAVFTPEDYETEILETIYTDLAPLDPDGVLHYEWVNARGCIARFDRGACEIRLLDTQECPEADLAIAACATGAVRMLAEGRAASPDVQRSFAADRLARILILTTRQGEEAVLRDAEYLAALGHPEKDARAGDLWKDLAVRGTGAPWRGDGGALDVILEEGTLATRLLRAIGPDVSPSADRLRDVYRELCRCLARGAMFHA